MKATVLIDNIANGELISEWGLSIYIQYEDKKILLDTGASAKFLKNARVLGIDLKDLNFAVLSHAHFDHAYGMRAFFKLNRDTVFYLREGSKENCYSRKAFFPAYIGIRKGTLKKYHDRICFASGDRMIDENIYLIPHKTEGLEKMGIANAMYLRENGKWIPDTFAHEQSLIFDTEKGLVIFNSCSHAGADVVIREAAETFPEKRIYALIGGFHLSKVSDDKVRALALRMKETGVEKVYTGHCTGKHAYRILHEELGDKVHLIETGMEIEL